MHQNKSGFIAWISHISIPSICPLFIVRTRARAELPTQWFGNFYYTVHDADANANVPIKFNDNRDDHRLFLWSNLSGYATRQRMAPVSIRMRGEPVSTLKNHQYLSLAMVFDICRLSPDSPINYSVMFPVLLRLMAIAKSPCRKWGVAGFMAT